jgi:MSHA biogenesis protein MshP
MCGSLRTPAAHAAGGFSLVSAIFLMVVLVILGVSLVTISSVQHTTTAQQLQAARANYAARAGAEWAAYQAGLGTYCPGPGYPMVTNFTLPAPLDAFAASVSCTRTSHSLDSGTKDYFVVDVTVTSGAYGGPDYVRRRVRTKVLGP